MKEQGAWNILTMGLGRKPELSGNERTRSRGRLDRGSSEVGRSCLCRGRDGESVLAGRYSGPLGGRSGNDGVV